jgi:hypothetical protein
MTVSPDPKNGGCLVNRDRRVVPHKASTLSYFAFAGANSHRYLTAMAMTKR